VRNAAGNQVLKGVSRSFYLTLRLLPEPMRGAASLGYLLARTSDTLADTAAVPAETRLACLERFGQAVAGSADTSGLEGVPARSASSAEPSRLSWPTGCQSVDSLADRRDALSALTGWKPVLQSGSAQGTVLGGPAVPLRWPTVLTNAVGDPRERLLLEQSDGLLVWLGQLPADEARLVREVVATIIGGQRLDLQRFATADQPPPVALADDADLEDYAWRVAGCVGAFWTHLGFLTLGERFSTAPADLLLDLGIAYGKGLQLVNILRDLPADLAAGRCYLPVADSRDTAELLESHRRWVVQADAWVQAGFAYSATLRSRRLRAATVLPAMLAKETLERLRGASWQDLQTRVKVPRSKVYLALVKAFGMKRVSPICLSTISSVQPPGHRR